jgi:hypothetical protein
LLEVDVDLTAGDVELLGADGIELGAAPGVEAFEGELGHVGFETPVAVGEGEDDEAREEEEGEVEGGFGQSVSFGRRETC